MSDISWFSNGLKHWQSKTEDWLLICLDPDEPLRNVVLEEGTHHYYSELYVFDPNRQEVVDEHVLDGPGPFDIPVQELGNFALLVRVHFLGFSRSPLESVEDTREVRGGQINSLRGEPYPILMQMSSDPALRVGKPVPRVPSEVYFEMRPPTEFPVVELRPGFRKNIPFQMSTPAPFATRIFLIGNQDVPVFTPGTEIEWSAVGSLPSITIKARQFAPTSTVNGAWTLAMPILQKNKDVGLVGQPFLNGPLISDLVLETLGKWVWASWKWLAPPRWLTVRLKWDFYRGKEWAETPDNELLITRQFYDRKSSVKLFERGSDHGGWNVELAAVPLLLGTPIESHRQTTFQSL